GELERPHAMRLEVVRFPDPLHRRRRDPLRLGHRPTTPMRLTRRLLVQGRVDSVIGAQVDPLPPFAAEMREVDGKPIGVIRVFASADVPHIVRGAGAVYVRSSKGKEPVDDHRTLLELARRGEEAEARARHRLVELPAVGYALRPPDWRPPGVVFADEVDVRYIA